MTDEELIARLRDAAQKRDEFEAVMLASVSADRIEALVKARREDALELLAAHGQAQDAYEAQLKAEARAERLEAALRLIEVIYYREDRELNWIAAHMRGCATAALKGEPLELYRRLAGGFPARAALEGDSK